MSDLALLLLRAVTGGLLAGHGAQKLFGWFGGNGLQGRAGWLESIGLKPGVAWAGMAGLGEFGGGVLTLLGLGGPLGSLLAMSSMGMATLKVHGGKPIWAAEGGAELPVVNIAASTALLLAGPGRYSLDRLFCLRVPTWLGVLTGLGAAVAVVVGLMMEVEPALEVAAPPLVGEGAA